MKGEVWRRSRYLVVSLLGYVEEEGEVRLPELVSYGAELEDEEGRPRWSARTVENATKDLAAFGAFRIASRGRDRVVEVTILGRAWAAGVLLPGPGELGKLEDAVVELEDEVGSW